MNNIKQEKKDAVYAALCDGLPENYHDTAKAIFEELISDDLRMNKIILPIARRVIGLMDLPEDVNTLCRTLKEFMERNKNSILYIDYDPAIDTEAEKMLELSNKFIIERMN